jgi:hypothetical protein
VRVSSRKKSEPPQPLRWNVYKIASKAVWLGEVEAPDEATAIEKGAVEFGVCQAADGDTVMAKRLTCSMRMDVPTKLPIDQHNLTNR